MAKMFGKKSSPQDNRTSAVEVETYTTYTIVGMDDKKFVIEETADESELRIKIIDKDGEKEIRFMSPHWAALHRLQYSIHIRDVVEEAKDLLNGIPDEDHA